MSLRGRRSGNGIHSIDIVITVKQTRTSRLSDVSLEQVLRQSSCRPTRLNIDRVRRQGETQCWLSCNCARSRKDCGGVNGMEGNITAKAKGGGGAHSAVQLQLIQELQIMWDVK